VPNDPVTEGAAAANRYATDHKPEDLIILADRLARAKSPEEYARLFKIAKGKDRPATKDPAPKKP
jgi:hypothetical protein